MKQTAPPSSKNDWRLVAVEDLLLRAKQLNYLDHDSANEAQQMGYTIALRILGENSAEVRGIEGITFRPRWAFGEIIAPRNDILTRGAWNDGVKKLQNALLFIRHGVQLRIAEETQARIEAEMPTEITVEWLRRNVSLRQWAIVAGVAISIASAGFLVGRSQLPSWWENIFQKSPPPKVTIPGTNAAIAHVEGVGVLNPNFSLVKVVDSP